MKCQNCAVKNRPDALYCRACGTPLERSHIGRDGDAQSEASNETAARGVDIDDEVDFTTTVSAKRVERLSRRGGLRHVALAAARGALALVLAAACVAVVLMWRSTRALQSQVSELSRGLKADQEEFERHADERKDSDRRAVLKEFAATLAKARAEDRKATSEAIKRAITEARGEDLKARNGEIARAIAEAREEDRGFIIAELTELKAKTKSREFGRHIERIIARFKAGGKPSAVPQREHADGRQGQRSFRRRRGMFTG